MRYIKIKQIIKKNVMVIIAGFCALVSMLFAPSADYVSYIDSDLLAVMFGFMAVIAGFTENNVFKRLTEYLTRLAKNMRRLTLILIVSVFFLAMFVTNDVALITFVPFTIAVYNQIGKDPILIVSLETIAANMGSAFTPFGNPQNLYVFSHSGMTLTEFFAITAPVCGLSLVMLMVASLAVKREAIQVETTEKTAITNTPYLLLYGVLFIMCILSVMGLCSRMTAFASVIAVIAICQPELFAEIDYGLLMTFVFIFIFIGNIKNNAALSSYISSAILGHELVASLLTSQVISNMPAAVMISGFSDKYAAIILGCDVGSLGTIISSLASLISLKIYSSSENSSTGRYILVFTLLNLIFLAVLFPVSIALCS
ncbi:MAG: citrate transporter [Oscillospiraceae bacterium]|nr:citrate transporter [Oscillospiraceae bacterium]